MAAYRAKLIDMDACPAVSDRNADAYPSMLDSGTVWGVGEGLRIVQTI